MSDTQGFSLRQSIQTRVLGGIALTIIIFILILYLPLRSIILNTFEDIELSAIQSDIARVDQAVQTNVVNLSRITRDYAHWDDTYAYAADPQAEYTDSNLSEDGLAALEVDLILIQDVQGSVLYARSYDPETAELGDIPTAFISKYEGALANHATTTSAITGIVLYQGVPTLIASYPILPTSAQGVIGGSFIMARKLDPGAVEGLSSFVQQPVEIWAVGDTLPSAVQIAREQLNRENPSKIETRSDNEIIAYRVFYDLLGQPTALVRLQQPRPIYTRALNAMQYTTIALLIAGMIICFVIVELMRRFVLNRVLKLNREMQAISQHPNSEARLTVRGMDEISQLGSTVNTMINAISDVQAARIKADDARERLQAEMIAIQQESLAKLSVPLIPINDYVVVMPLIGAIDASRGARIRDTLLRGIMERRAHTAIIDITGLDSVDTALAELLLQLARATQLVGARVFITGMQSSVAHILIDLNINMNHLATYSTLQQGIAAALKEEARIA